MPLMRRATISYTKATYVTENLNLTCNVNEVQQHEHPT